jgi:hypothetical protein
MKPVFEVWRLELIRELIDLLDMLSTAELNREEFIEILKNRVDYMALLKENTEIRENLHHELAIVCMVAMVKIRGYEQLLGGAVKDIENWTEHDCEALINDGLLAIANAGNPPEDARQEPEQKPFFF